MFLEPNREVTDEQIMAVNMVSWLINKLKSYSPLLNDFVAAGDATRGEMYWPSFCTLFVELLLSSNDYLRANVFLGETSVVSLREIRKACELLWCVLDNFLRIRVNLDQTFRNREFLHFWLLQTALQISLVNTYCLRLSAKHRIEYLIRIHVKWNTIRQRFPSHVVKEFMSLRLDQPTSVVKSEAFDELAAYIVKDLNNPTLREGRERMVKVKRRCR